jgi:hypothetical protein
MADHAIILKSIASEWDAAIQAADALDRKLTAQIQFHQDALLASTRVNTTDSLERTKRIQGDIALQNDLRLKGHARRSFWKDGPLQEAVGRPSPVSNSKNPYVFPNTKGYFMLEGMILRDGEEVTFHPLKIDGVYPGTPTACVGPMDARVSGTIRVRSDGEAVLLCAVRPKFQYPIAYLENERHPFYGNIVSSCIQPL